MQPHQAAGRNGSRDRARRMLVLVAAALLGGLCSSLGVLAFVMLSRQERLPQLTRQQLSEAMQRWEQISPPSYDIEIKLKTRGDEVHRIKMRDRQVVAYWRNEIAMRRKRTFDTWTVDGMFSTIERDLEHVEAIAEGTADALTPRLMLWATFDSQFGYPSRYRRVQWGADGEVTWQVVTFTVIE